MLFISAPFEDQLMVLDYNIPVRTVADGVAVLPYLDEILDLFSKFIRFRFLEARP